MPGRKISQWGFWVRLVLVGMTFLSGLSFFPAAQSQHLKPSDEALLKGNEDGEDEILARERWFFEQRAYPLGYIRPNARLEAWEYLGKEFIRDRPFLPESAPVQGNVWTSIGPAPLTSGSTPYSGRITTIAPHPSNASIVYIGAAQGGVWKTTNTGASWTPLTDSQASLAMGALALDPSNSNIIYAGTGEQSFSFESYFGAGLLKSTDGGATWTRLAVTTFSRTSFSKIVIDPTNTNTLYAATTTGVGGFNGGFPPSIPPRGVYKSTDGGVSWTQVLDASSSGSGGATDLVMDPVNPLILYAAVDSVGIFKTVTGGSSWLQLAGGLPTSSVGRVQLAIAPTVSLTLYTGIEDSSSGQLLGLWKTIDGGTTWTQMSGTPNYCNAQCWYDNVLVVDPTNANTVYASGLETYKSTDGASTWACMTCTVPVHVDNHALAFGPGGRLWVGNDGGIWYTDDGGTNWVNRNTNLAITQFYWGVSAHPTNASIVLGGTQDNGTNKYGGSLSWPEVMGGDGASTAIDFTNPDNVCYASFQYLEIRKSTSNCNSFPTDATSGLPRSGGSITFASFIDYFTMCPDNANVLITGTGTVYRTDNGAGSWTANSPNLEDPNPPTNGRIQALAFIPGTSCNSYLAGTNHGKLFLTTVGGGTSSSNWSSDLLAVGVPDRYITKVVAVDSNTWYVTLSGFCGANPCPAGSGHIFKTTNSGSSWTDISNLLPDIPCNAFSVDPFNPNVLHVGTDLGVFKSSDGGATWSIIASNSGMPNVAVYDLVVNHSTGVLIAATHGRSMFKVGTQVFSAGTSAAFRVQRDTGNVLTDGAFNSGQNLGGSFNVGIAADIAERIRASEPLEPGNLVEIDIAHPGKYRKARPGKLVVGVISTHPGMTLANDARNFVNEKNDDRPLLVLIGRTFVKATSENGPIRPGDLLVVSATHPGYAMRCAGFSRLSQCDGAIVGKALETLESEEGLITALVMSR